MKTTTWEEFDKEYTAFARKHNAKAERKESSILEGNMILKTVTWTDGAAWWEVTECEVWEEVEVEIHGLKIKVSVPFRRTEYWSTESGGSKYYYTNA